MVILITGKQNAGKTFYATSLKLELELEGRKVVLLDGDEWRQKHKNTDFSDEGRIINLISASKEAERFENMGYIVLMSFIAPKKKWRETMSKYWSVSRVVYIPGGTLWEGTSYEKPDDEELNLKVI